MKKILALLVAGMTMVAVFAGCSQEDIDSTSVDSNQIIEEVDSTESLEQEAPDKEPPEIEPVEDAAIVSASGILKVHFLDVGQGDSTFLELPDGKTMLVDAGESSEAGVVVGYIQSLGYSSIDYVVATHPHADHIGGLPGVFSSFQVNEVWAPRVSHTTATYEAFLDSVAAEGLTINTAFAGSNIYSANGCTLDILSPKASSYADLNDWSVIIKAVFGDNEVLLTGDAGSSVITASNPGEVDILKVGHHGSDTSTNAQLIALLAPTYSVISCGAGNSYGHPTDIVLSALSATTVLRTDVDGTVAASLDGVNITWETGITAPRASVVTPDQTPEPEPAPAPAEISGSGAMEVYITETGAKYHLNGCRHLSKSKIPVSLTDAKNGGYEPCKTCNPPS